MSVCSSEIPPEGLPAFGGENSAGSYFEKKNSKGFRGAMRDMLFDDMLVAASKGGDQPDLGKLDDCRRRLHVEQIQHREDQRRIREKVWQAGMQAHAERERERTVHKDKQLNRDREWDILIERERARQEDSVQEFSDSVTELKREWREELDRERECERQREAEWQSMINSERVRLRQKLEDFDHCCNRERQKWRITDTERTAERDDYLRKWEEDRTREREREAAFFSQLRQQRESRELQWREELSKLREDFMRNPHQTPEQIETEPPQQSITPSLMSEYVDWVMKVASLAGKISSDMEGTYWGLLLHEDTVGHVNYEVPIEEYFHIISAGGEVHQIQVQPAPQMTSEQLSQQATEKGLTDENITQSIMSAKKTWASLGKIKTETLLSERIIEIREVRDQLPETSWVSTLPNSSQSALELLFETAAVGAETISPCSSMFSNLLAMLELHSVSTLDRQAAEQIWTTMSFNDFMKWCDTRPVADKAAIADALNS